MHSYLCMLMLLLFFFSLVIAWLFPICLCDDLSVYDHCVWNLSNQAKANDAGVIWVLKETFWRFSFCVWVCADESDRALVCLLVCVSPATSVCFTEKLQESFFAGTKLQSRSFFRLNRFVNNLPCSFSIDCDESFFPVQRFFVLNGGFSISDSTQCLTLAPIFGMAERVLNSMCLLYSCVLCATCMNERAHLKSVVVALQFDEKINFSSKFVSHLTHYT